MGDEQMRVRILNPQGRLLLRWNIMFLCMCFVAPHIDLLFFFVEVIDDNNKCLDLESNAKIVVCVLRSILDILYIFRIIFQFRKVAQSSAEFKGYVAMMKRYLSSSISIDILSIIPLPQGVVLEVCPSSFASTDLRVKVTLLQFFLRLCRIFAIQKEISLGRLVIAWTGRLLVAFRLNLCLLAVHVIAAYWYSLSIDSELRCWHGELNNASFLRCGHYHHNQTRISALTNSCTFVSLDDPKSLEFGIFIDAVRYRVAASSTGFSQRLFYCFWWSVHSLSSLGQNLAPSISVEEIAFAVLVFIYGLFCSTTLLTIIQSHLQLSITRQSEANIKRQEIELWMYRKKLPEYLRERIRGFEDYKSKESKNVDEETLIRNFPKDLRRDVKRHLCLDLLIKVPRFETMDARLLDALCERLKPALYREQTCIFCEGESVDEMIFIKRGSLNTMTTNGGTPGFLKSSILKAGEFCGEELVTWAFDPNFSSKLPISTRTVESLSEVEAYALMADDLKFVASQLHRKDLLQSFRYHSQQWRTWATCIIQKAWLHYREKKMEQSLFAAEARLRDVLAGEVHSPNLGLRIRASRFAANALQSPSQIGESSGRFPQ